MILAHEKQFELLDAQIKKAHATAKGKTTVCVLPHTGLGDRMRALAFCPALRRHYAKRDLHIFFPWWFDQGALAVAGLDIAHNAQLMCMINAHAPARHLPRRLFIGWARERFDVVFDLTGPAVAAYWADDDDEQRKADKALLPFFDLYAGQPLGNWKLIYEPYSQWEMMAASSGVPVDEDDLVPTLECAPIVPETWEIALGDGSMHDQGDLATHLGRDAGCGDWEKSRFTGRRYVVLHNSAGGGAIMKEAPAEVFAAVVKRLADEEVKCVQVGGKGDARIEGTLDRRGHRLPMVSLLIGESLGVVACEGLLPYVARGMNTQSTVLFGPTPYAMYSMKGNVNLINATAEEGTACPIQSCFWGAGGYALPRSWYAGCIMDGHPFVKKAEVKSCLNMPAPEVAAEAASAMAQRVEKDRKGEAA